MCACLRVRGQVIVRSCVCCLPPPFSLNSWRCEVNRLPAAACCWGRGVCRVGGCPGGVCRGWPRRLHLQTAAGLSVVRLFEQPLLSDFGLLLFWALPPTQPPPPPRGPCWSHDVTLILSFKNTCLFVQRRIPGPERRLAAACSSVWNRARSRFTSRCRPVAECLEGHTCTRAHATAGLAISTGRGPRLLR